MRTESGARKTVQFGRERSLSRFKVAENNHSVGKGGTDDVSVTFREINTIKENTCACTETVGKVSRGRSHTIPEL